MNRLCSTLCVGAVFASAAFSAAAINAGPPSCAAKMGADDGRLCPGEPLSVPCLITNTGQSSGTFDWTVSKISGFAAVTIVPSSGSVGIAAGMTYNFNVDVTAAAGQTGLIDALLKLDVNSGACSATSLVRIKPASCSVTLESGAGCQGETVLLPVTITNTGTCTETFDWFAKDLGGPATIVLNFSGVPIQLAPGAAVGVQVAAEIDPASIGGEQSIGVFVLHRDGVCEATATLTVFAIGDVDWLGVNPGDGQTFLYTTTLNGGGKRLFPEKNQPGAAGFTHRRVFCRARLTNPVPPGQSVTVRFRIFDVDDPTKNGAANPADPNDTAVAFSGGDNRPHGAGGNGPLGIAPAGIEERVIMPGGQNAAVEYTVQNVNPGNNWKVFVSCNNAEINDVEVNPTVENGLNATNSFRRVSSPATIPPITRQSPLLSNWRTLYVETDSMGAELDTGTSTALTATVLTDMAKRWVANQFNSFAEMWRLNPNTAQATSFVVTNTQAGPSRVTTPGDHTTVAAAGNAYCVTFTGFAADDTLRGNVADPDMGAFDAAFRPCYIFVELIADATGNNGTTPWHYHFNNSTANLVTYGNGQRGNIPEDDDFWRAHIIGLYEVPLPAFDNDPDAEANGAIAGATDVNEPEFSCNFAEVDRDLAAQHGWNAAQILNDLRGVALHEIGHHFGLAHPPQADTNHVMWVANTDAEENTYGTLPLVFQDADIHIIRQFGTGQRP